MQNSTPFLMGVNYWPRKKAMYFWRDFDAGEVREEFAMIREMGLSVVRIFLLWESFQPNPRNVSAKAMRDLATVCDIASDVGLKLEPTFFTGHMSGPNWAPDWLLDPSSSRQPGELRLVSLSRNTASPHRIFNTYTTPFVIEAEKLQLRTICGEFASHPSIFAWSLGNEPDLFCQPPDAVTGMNWVREMVQTIKSVDPNHPVLMGLHAASVWTDCGLRIDQISKVTDISVMHGYSVYDRIARVPLDPDYVPFLACLTAALAQKPVLFEEFGICTDAPDAPSRYREICGWDGTRRKQYFASEDDAASYYANVLPRLLKVGALGAFAWCFADYDRSLWQSPPCDSVEHERFFGLVRPDGSFKSAANAVAKFAQSNPVVQPQDVRLQLPVSADVYYRDPGKYVPSLYDQFGKVEL
jgi:endo-1,4-beta-mannosidase